MTTTRFAAAALAGLALAACQGSLAAEMTDSGTTVTRNVALTAFHAVEVSGAYDVKVSEGGTPGAQLVGGDKILDQTIVTVENGVLKIKPKSKGMNFHFGKGEKLTVTVTGGQAIDAAAIAGSGDLEVNGASGASFNGSVAGSGDLSVSGIKTGDASFAIAGSGDVRAVGTATATKYSIAGSGDIDASALTAKTTSVSIAGSGNVNANASDTADVTIMGSGDAEISGGAKCSLSRNGSGEARCS